jgi:8-oxo-dGTP pyrophosphatase MutT (NUDIX family)
MNVEECREKFPNKLRIVSLVFLLKGDEILLAMKKRGFGVGRWNGSGGKTNEGESVEEAAVREVEEEIGVTPTDLTKVAVLDFFFPLAPEDQNWNQQVHVFMSKKWTGEPSESEEMKPQWFNLKDIPYKEMWSDDILWLPDVLLGKKVKAGFVFGKNDTITSHEVKSDISDLI